MRKRFWQNMKCSGPVRLSNKQYKKDDLERRLFSLVGQHCIGVLGGVDSGSQRVVVSLREQILGFGAVSIFHFSNSETESTTTNVVPKKSDNSEW